jgi:hypothetical protein
MAGILRGDIVWANLAPTIGNEQAGKPEGSDKVLLNVAVNYPEAVLNAVFNSN